MVGVQQMEIVEKWEDYHNYTADWDIREMGGVKQAEIFKV